MKNKVQKCFGVLLLIVAAYIYAHIAKANIIFDKEVDTSDYLNTGAVVDDTIEQSFFSKEETLDGMSIKCILLGIPDDVKILYSLEEKKSGKLVANGEISAKVLKNSKFNILSFKTISNCKGKEYLFKIREVNSTPENSVAFCYQTKSEKNSKLYIRGQQTEGTLIMKTITNRFDVETFIVTLLFVLYIIMLMKFLYKLFR